MNDILEFLNSHGSVRRFTDQPISEADEHLICNTARRSPTSSNLQAYSIVSIRNQQTKSRLAVLCGSQDHVGACPLFLVFCADLYRLSLLNRERGYPFNGEYAEMFIVATVDAALVAGRALMAAQALGMGGVMVGGIRTNVGEVSELLALPDLVYPVMGMSLGYPAKPPRVKLRLPEEAVLFSEKYDPSTIPQAVDVYDKEIDELGYLRGREVETEKYPDFDETYSWAEHSARRMASDSPAARRGHMLEYLRKRGFLRK